MTVQQIRAVLLAVPNQQAEVQRVQVLETAPGSGGSQQVLGVFFEDGTIDYFDAAGKPVIET